ncbi:RraA family protein [Burkholderia stagnalis]
MSTTLPAAIIEGFNRVSVPNVADALDRLKLPAHPPGILPLWDSCKKLVGQAATLKLVPIEESSESAVIGTLRAILAGNKGDVLVIDHDGRTDLNAMGGVAGATAAHHGLIGCVIDGVSRDIDEFRELGFGVYGKGRIQKSIRSRSGVAHYGQPVQLGGVPVKPGDLIIADDNGIEVVPLEHAEEVMKLAQQLKHTEDSVIAAVRSGVDPIEAHEQVNYDRMLQAS